MIFRKTISTRKKEVYKNIDSKYKRNILIETKTYWILFIPVLSVDIKEL